MKNIDVEFIHRVLDDDNTFETLVKKYRKPVHALVWRKIGDFHIAEESLSKQGTEVPQSKPNPQPLPPEVQP